MPKLLKAIDTKPSMGKVIDTKPLVEKVEDTKPLMEKTLYPQQTYSVTLGKGQGMGLLLALNYWADIEVTTALSR